MSKNLFSIKDYMKFNLNEQENQFRRQIRLIKHDIRAIHSLRAEVDKKSEKEVRGFLESEPELLKEYDELVEKLKDKEEREIRDMIKRGIIREKLEETDGKEE